MAASKAARLLKERFRTDRDRLQARAESMNENYQADVWILIERRMKWFSHKALGAPTSSGTRDVLEDDVLVAKRAEIGRGSTRAMKEKFRSQRTVLERRARRISSTAQATVHIYVRRRGRWYASIHENGKVSSRASQEMLARTDDLRPWNPIQGRYRQAHDTIPAPVTAGHATLRRCPVVTGKV